MRLGNTHIIEREAANDSKADIERVYLIEFRDSKGKLTHLSEVSEDEIQQMHNATSQPEFRAQIIAAGEIGPRAMQAVSEKNTRLAKKLCTNFRVADLPTPMNYVRKTAFN